MISSKAVTQSGMPSYTLQRNAALQVKPSVAAVFQSQPQRQKKAHPTSAQDTNKDEGAQFQWTPGQGVDVSDVYPAGRSDLHLDTIAPIKHFISFCMQVHSL